MQIKFSTLLPLKFLKGNKVENFQKFQGIRILVSIHSVFMYSIDYPEGSITLLNLLSDLKSTLSTLSEDISLVG